MVFSLSSACYDMVFYVGLLQRGAFYYFVAMFYLCRGDTDRHSRIY